MTDQHDSSIIRSENTSLSKTPALSNPIVSRMAGDVLSRVKSNQVVQERIQLGDYSFRTPDYRQIMKWSQIFNLDPLSLLRLFEETSWEPLDGSEFDPIKFEVHDGSIQNLGWDFGHLPFVPCEWEQGLKIMSIGFRGSSTGELNI